MSFSLPAIFSIEGLTLSASEKDFFRQAAPIGFILFKRNIDAPDQVQKLTDDLQESLGWACPILIDQEGGRVRRIGPPHWPAYPAAQTLFSVADVENTHQAIAHDLKTLGISVNCAPVLDVLHENTHEAIGDRAFSDDPEDVFQKGSRLCEVYLAQGITPVIKHMPGQGRAACDSHHHLPIVETVHEELRQTDFLPFQKIARCDFADQIWGMTTHTLYQAIDSDLPASLSPTIIQNIIRGEINFDGLLLTDDLSMHALDSYGDLGERACKALEAGSDVALYCAGKLKEMEELATHLPGVRPETMKRYERSDNARISRRPAA